MIRRALCTFAAILPLALLVGCNRASEPAPAPKSQPPTPKAKASTAPETPTRYPAPERLVAFGDVHGDMQALQGALKLAGVVDEAGHWSGGKTVVVQTGDVLDRGDDERAMLDLISRLEKEAAAAGGALIALNGNHETMNVALDLRYVTPGGFEDFADGAGADLNAPALADFQPDKRGRVAAFAPGGPYAKVMAHHNVMAIVGESVFVHGGVLPAVVKYGLERLNAETRAWMWGEGPMPALIHAPDGPVWSRHYSNDTDREDCQLLEAALKGLKAKRMVVGHTVQEHGITHACDQQVWRVDVGMAASEGFVSTLFGPIEQAWPIILRMAIGSIPLGVPISILCYVVVKTAVVGFQHNRRQRLITASKRRLRIARLVSPTTH